MEKQIINRGYLTFCLTDGDDFFYGLYKKRDYDWRWKTLYWSEVFVDGDAFSMVRKGEKLEGKTDKELDDLLEQSFVNLGWVNWD